MKITIISCGGTICGINDNSVIRQTPAGGRIISDLDKHLGDFSFVDISSVASENNNGIRISDIVNTVLENISTSDGIIILHGTDTLQYTASALSYACGSATIPIVLVSSNYIPDDKRSNGYINFYSAVSFIQNHCGFGVFVIYKNIENKFTTVHRGSRLLSHCDYSDSLHSLFNQYYGQFADGKFYKDTSYSAHKDEAEPFGKIYLPQLNSKVLIINAYPGMDFNMSFCNISAVLIKCYHSGTLPTSGTNFKDFAEKINENNIPCFLSGGNDIIYESSEEFDSLGFIRLPAASFPSQYMKLWLGTETNTDLKNLMSSSLGEDLI